MFIGGSLPKDTYGITYRGKHSGRDFDMWLIKSPIDFLVESVDNLESVPDMDGAHDFGATLGVRYIQMELVIRAKSEQELREKRRAVASWLSPAKGLADLVWDTEPTRKYSARRAGADAQLTQKARQGHFQLTMVAPDPYAYSSADETLILNAPGSTGVVNAGTEDSYPAISIKGTNSTGSLTISYAGKSFTYKGSLASGETAVVDMQGMTVYKTNSVGIVTNQVNDHVGAFPILPPGNSTLSIQTTGFTLTELRFNPRSRWT